MAVAWRRARSEPGELAIGDVADQRVPEGELDVARQARVATHADEVQRRQALERAVDRGRAVGVHPGELDERAAPEPLPHHRRVPGHRADARAPCGRGAPR